MAAQAEPLIGWYGKLPSRGDFVGRGLPRVWQDTWEHWLQRSLAGAAKRLGAAPLRECLAAMRPWQAVVLAPHAGEPAWWGVVVASADRVGRVFPLLVVQPCDAAVLEHVALADLEARGRRLVERLDVLRPTASPKELEAGLASVASAPWPLAAVAPQAPDDALAAWRASRPEALSFWWRVGSVHTTPAPRAEGWPPRDELILDWLDRAIDA
jgi:type VI secretion system protein ImpM